MPRIIMSFCLLHHIKILSFTHALIDENSWCDQVNEQHQLESRLWMRLSSQWYLMRALFCMREPREMGNNRTEQNTAAHTCSEIKVKRNQHWMGYKVYKPIRSTNLEKYLLVETEKHRPNDNLRNRDRENIKVHSDSSNWSHNYHTIWP